jgi:hypothetical protein
LINSKLHFAFPKSTVFCDVTCFTLVSSSAYSLTLKMEAIYSSETSVDFQRTTIPEDRTPHIHRRENLRLCDICFAFCYTETHHILIFFCPWPHSKFLGNSFSCSMALCRNLYVLSIMVHSSYFVWVPRKRETLPYPHFPESCIEISETLCDQLLVQDKLQLRAIVNTVMNHWAPWNTREVLD